VNRISWTDRVGAQRTASTGSAAVFSTQKVVKPRRESLRVKWQLKAALPVAFVLFVGILLFLLATVGLTIAQRHTLLTLAAGGAVAICAALLIGVALVVGRPMLELQETIARVRAGDMDARVGFSERNDEVGDLGRAFNEMVGELQESREEIQRLHRTQMSRAEHLATLGEMAAGLAHEIRNPLAGIAGFIEIIGQELPEASSARGVLKEVRSEVQHINRIVTELLETARPKEPSMQVADLNATAEHALMFARQHAVNRPIEFEFRRADHLPMLEHDPGQIRQVLLNLLLNAVNAIDGDGNINVTVERRDRFATVSVSDSGRGIAPEHLPYIFRPFFTTRVAGTGLGLAMVKRIVEDHAGRVEVSSCVGKGSEFVVFLPLARESAA